MTNEQRHDYIAALIRERDGYARNGQDELVAEVDAELERLGHRATTPAKRSTRLIAARGTEL